MSTTTSSKSEGGKESKVPAVRKLRGYAFDPSMSLKLETAPINELVYKIPWEALETHGPVGEYLEVIDYDPTVEKLYTPVNLNEVYALVQEGLDPDVGNPQFHQQMVYAVAMTTIRNFEAALGRKVLWAPQRMQKQGEAYVQRLRIYPHALREANAYYSPQKKALLFGYFQAMPADQTRHMPDALVFTCLSHDIIAHEVTHAILDGMYPYYNEPSNPDVLAFHEAFADIVALFQHFTFPEVLKHQISRTKGDLAKQNLLGQLAQEFGDAIGSYGSLRDAIGGPDKKTGEWKPAQPSPADYESTEEPHARGSILVAAVFEAFTRMYEHEVADLLRIAKAGAGVEADGTLHPDLVNRLAAEAARCSQRVLNMCIRALDYCPPVDLTFGDFLRGVITADIDLKGEEFHEFRLAFIDAFRRRGIYPRGLKALSVDSIAHSKAKTDAELKPLLDIIGEFLRDYRTAVSYKTDREKVYQISQQFSGGANGLHARINWKFDGSLEFQNLTGLAWENWWAAGVANGRGQYGGPRFAVQNLRLVSRTDGQGAQTNYIVFSILQKAGVTVTGHDIEPKVLPDEMPEGDETLIFRGGCTFIYDLDSLDLKYVISKPLLEPTAPGQPPALDKDRVLAQHEYQFETGPAAMSEFRQYFDPGFTSGLTETFALLHQH